MGIFQMQKITMGNTLVSTECKCTHIRYIQLSTVSGIMYKHVDAHQSRAHLVSFITGAADCFYSYICYILDAK